MAWVVRQRKADILIRPHSIYTLYFLFSHPMAKSIAVLQAFV